MDSSNVASLAEDDDCMPVQSTNPISQMGGDDGHLPLGAGLLSIGSTCDIHTTKKKMNASSVDSVLVLLPGMLQFQHCRSRNSQSSHSTIGRMEGFQKRDGVPSINNLTLTLGGGSASNSSGNTNREVEHIASVESPKIVLRGRAIPSKTTFVLLHVTSSTKHMLTKKQPPPKVVCKGVFHNVLVFGEGTMTASPVQNGVDDASDSRGRWRHYGASERCGRDDFDSEEESLSSSIPVQKSKQDAALGKTPIVLMHPDPIKDDTPAVGQTQVDAAPSAIDRNHNGDSDADSSCCIVKESSKVSPRRLPARKTKQLVSYQEVIDVVEDMDSDDIDEVKPGSAKKLKLELPPVSRSSQRGNTRTRRNIESLASPLDDNVVFVNMETEVIQQPKALGSVTSCTRSAVKMDGAHREEIDASIPVSEVASFSVAPNDDGHDSDSKRSSGVSSKGTRRNTSRLSTSNSLKHDPNEDVLIVNSEQSAASSNRLRVTSTPSTPSKLSNANSSTPNSSKKRRRRPIASTPPKAQAHSLTVDEDDEFAFLGE